MGLRERIEKIKEQVREFPLQPGVYLMKNNVGKIIYVGKAKLLRNRVRSYFGESKGLSSKTRYLVSHVEQVDYILTKTEVEAFLLEASLIKKHRPKYNIRLKDDKSYPYIRISMQDTFPRFYLSRKVKKDGSLYFGPFTSGFAVHQTIHLLNQIFQIRDCSDHFMKNRVRPCMTHQIGRCTAPCVGKINSADYKNDLQGAIEFLRGRNKSVIKNLNKKMIDAATGERFEEAARLRDGIQALEKVLEKQAVVLKDQEIDQDFIGFYGDHRGTTIETLHVRSGRMVGSRPHFIGHLNTQDPGEDPKDWLTSFLNQYYDEDYVPDEVILPIDIGGDLTKLLEAVLFERKGKEVKVKMLTSSKAQSQLLELADQNAKEHFQRQVEKSDQKLIGLEEIQKKFNLPELPMRIECFDISHFQGQDTVASQVVFEEGVPAKDQYRMYKIRTPVQSDDYAAMKEVLERRLKHVEYDDPQLIVIDGGKGQLKVVTTVLQELGRQDLRVISLAKSRTQGEFSDAEVSATQERFFIPGVLKPVTFKPNSEAFRILVSIRDEAHRFAITYHRKLREGAVFDSALDRIPGLGEKRKKQLLDHFGSVESIRNAGVYEISSITGFNENLAKSILEGLKE